MSVKENVKQDFQLYVISCSLFIELDLRISLFFSKKIIENIMTEGFSMGVLETAKAR